MLKMPKWRSKVDQGTSPPLENEKVVGETKGDVSGGGGEDQTGFTLQVKGKERRWHHASDSETVLCTKQADIQLRKLGSCHSRQRQTQRCE